MEQEELNLSENGKLVLKHISEIQSKVVKLIDDYAFELEEPITITEIVSALTGALKNFNSREVVQLIKQ